VDRIVTVQKAEK